MFHNKVRLTRLSVIAILIVMMLLFTNGNKSINSILTVSATTQPIFHPGCGTANIDGNVDPNEWYTADSLLLPMVNADTPLSGTFYVMQSGADLYLGFTINDDEITYDPVGKFGIKGDMLSFDFDDNNSGSLFEVGENKVSGYSYAPWIRDAFFNNTTGSSDEDINDGGVANGTASSARHGDKNHFEISFPLCSGDTGHDFCLQPGDIVGFRIEYDDAFFDGPEFDYDSMFYPGTEVFNSLALIEIGLPCNTYLPLISK